MLKITCLMALFAVVAAQNWGWPQPINPRPPVWNDPQIPIWPQPPNWNPPTNPGQERVGVRDNRCPLNNERFVTLFPHERDCSQFYICSYGFRCKKT